MPLGSNYVRIVIEEGKKEIRKISSESESLRPTRSLER